MVVYFFLSCAGPVSDSRWKKSSRQTKGKNLNNKCDGPMGDIAILFYLKLNIS